MLYHKRDAPALTFELTIGPRNADGYPVTARAPGGEEAAAIMRLSLMTHDLERQLSAIRDAVLASSAHVRRIPTLQERPVQEFGSALFEAIMTDDVRVLFGASYQRAREQESDLRLVLKVQPPELARLPWEFLFDAGREEYLSLRWPLVRYPLVMEPVRALTVNPPLRILGMVAMPSDRGALDVKEEQRRLREAVAELERDDLVQLSWVRGQTWRDLQESMDAATWHVLHFIGHGGFDPVTDEGVIALADERSRTQLLGATALHLLLCDHPSLRMVVLNACETGRASTLGAFSSTAGALIRGGVPAVVAMQFQISDRGAIEFARSLYQGIAGQRPVDVSIMRARRAMHFDHKSLEWGIPVLYLRSPDGILFDLVDVVCAEAPGVDERPSGEVDLPEALRDQGLAAFYEEQWDQAVDTFEQIVAYRPGDTDARAKLDHARKHAARDARYAQAQAAVEVADWDEAIKGFAAVLAEDPEYRDSKQWLEEARRQQKLAEHRQTLAGLVAEARRFYRTGHWKATVKIRQQLVALLQKSVDLGCIRMAVSAEPVQVIPHRERVNALAFSSDSRLLCFGSRWKTAYIREVETGRTLIKVRYSGLLNQVNSVMFSPDGHKLATASSDGTARVWDANTGEELTRVHHDGAVNRAVNCAVLSPDGHKLATASSDGTARVWDANTGEELARVTHDWGVTGVAFGLKGSLLATITANARARVWDVVTDEEFGGLTYEHWAMGAVSSRDGRLLANSDPFNAVCIISDAATKERLAIVAGSAIYSGDHSLPITHSLYLMRTMLSSEGHLLTGAVNIWDHRALIWDADTGLRVASIPGNGDVRHATFSSDGRLLAITGSEPSKGSFWGATRIWVLHSSNDNE